MTLTSEYKNGDDYYTNDVIRITCIGRSSMGLALYEDQNRTRSQAGCIVLKGGRLFFHKTGIFKASPSYISIRRVLTEGETGSRCSTSGSGRIALELSITIRRNPPTSSKFFCGYGLGSTATYSTEFVEISQIKGTYTPGLYRSDTQAGMNWDYHHNFPKLVRYRYFPLV